MGIQKHFNRDPNSSRELLQTDPLPFDMTIKKGAHLREFVQARCMRSSTDTRFKEPKNVGTVAEAYVTALRLRNAGPNAQPTTEEYTWTFMAFRVYRMPIILQQKVQPNTETNRITPAARPSAVERTLIVASGEPIDSVNYSPAIVNNPTLVDRARCRLICASSRGMDISIITDDVRRQITVAISMINARFTYYKAVRVANTKELQYHWVFMAYQANFQRCIEIIFLVRNINKNLEAAASHDSMLCPV